MSVLTEAFARHGITRCAILATTFRSGSSWTGAMMSHSGLGTIRNERFKTIWKQTDFPAYLDEVIGPGEGGLFATKLMWPQRNNLARLSGYPRAASAAFAAAFPGAEWMFLRRRDVFRQAISFWRAKKSNRWHVFDDEPEPEIEYSFREIDACLRELVLHDRLWSDFFALAGVTPLVLDYEDVLAEPEILNDFLGRFGLRLGTRPVRLKKQSDAQSEHYLDRYLSDLYELGR